MVDVAQLVYLAAPVTTGLANVCPVHHNTGPNGILLAGIHMWNFISETSGVTHPNTTVVQPQHELFHNLLVTVHQTLHLHGEVSSKPWEHRTQGKGRAEPLRETYSTGLPDVTSQ